MSKYCDFFTKRKRRCYPIEIINKEEKPTGEFICMYCHKSVEVAIAAKRMKDVIEDAKGDKNYPIPKCSHKKTVAINEEGHAGVYCVDCGEQLEREC